MTPPEPVSRARALLDQHGLVDFPHRDVISDLLAHVERLEAALRKVRGHTSYLPGAPDTLLAELLASVERIVDAALAGEEGNRE